MSHLSPQMRVGEDWYKGTADAVYQNLYHLEELDAEYILILSGDHIYKMDYGHFIRYPQKRKADLTISAIEVDLREAHRLVLSRLMRQAGWWVLKKSRNDRKRFREAR